MKTTEFHGGRRKIPMKTPCTPWFNLLGVKKKRFTNNGLAPLRLGVMNSSEFKLTRRRGYEPKVDAKDAGKMSNCNLAFFASFVPL
jgi:hypothetical protein